MTLRIVAAVIAAVFALAACDSDDGATIRSEGSASGSGSGSGSGTGTASGSGTEAEACSPGDESDPALVVRLDEFSVIPEEEELTPGPIRFRAANSGELTHELYLVEARNVAGLPLDKKGSVDTEALEEDDRVVGEVEGIPSGESCDLEAELELGTTYVLFCNIRERTDKGVVNHFLQGMRARVKVS